MVIKHKWVAVVFASLILLGLGGCHPGFERARKRVVKIAILPEYSAYLMDRKYRPLMEYLQEETDYQVERVSAISYSQFLSSLEGSKADFSFQNPYFYILLAKTRGAKPIAENLTPQGKPSSYGLIIAHKDSPITRIEDLRGKRVMIPSKRAMFGYLAQAILCLDHGINPEKDLTIVLGRRHDQVVLNVYNKKVDAGFVKPGALSLLKNFINISQIKVIARTAHFPNWCFASFPETDRRVVERVKTALLKLNPDNPKHHQILEKAELGGFVEASDDKYNLVRRAIQRLKIPY